MINFIIAISRYIILLSFSYFFTHLFPYDSGLFYSALVIHFIAITVTVLAFTSWIKSHVKLRRQNKN